MHNTIVSQSPVFVATPSLNAQRIVTAPIHHADLGTQSTQYSTAPVNGFNAIQTQIQSNQLPLSVGENQQLFTNDSIPMIEKKTAACPPTAQTQLRNFRRNFRGNLNGKSFTRGRNNVSNAD